MKREKKFEELGIEIPVVTEINGTESEINQKIEELKENVKTEFEKIITYCTEESNISKEKLEEYRNDFLKKEYFTKAEHITDEKIWNELQTKWFELNKKYFELQLKLSETGCDEYDLNYTGESEFYQFFHEDPGKRRKRLEVPIQQKIEVVEKEIAKIDYELKALTIYSIKGDKKDIYESFENMYKKMLQAIE